MVSGPTRAFLQTRGTGRAGDYAFLGYAPEEPWWRAYRDVTAFDHPTVLVTADGARWAAYLSGIPSSRVDAVGTVVRYTLVLDGPCGAVDADCVVAAVAAWLDDVATGPDRPGGLLSTALDAAFPAELVDRMITRPVPGGVDPAAGDAGGRGLTLDQLAPRYCTDASSTNSGVLRALASLPVPPSATDEPGAWIGGVATPACRVAFVARVVALLEGAPGRALLLNLLGGPDDAGALLDPASPLAVLADGAAPSGVTPLRSEVDAKNAPAPPAGAVTARPATAVPATWSAGAVAVATTVLAVAIAVLAAVLILLL